MTSIKFVEDIISAHLDSNNKKIISLLEKEITRAKSQGKYNVAKRLKNLLEKIPTNSFSAQSATNKTVVPMENSLLFQKINSTELLEDVILETSAQKLISEFLREWEDYSKLTKFGIFPTNKLLFYGPPGTGKTKLAYAIANKLNFPLILVRLDELISSYLGKTGKNIREIFDIALNENVVILLDEIDTVAKHRNDERELGELKRVVTVLLQNIDNFPHNSIIIGATNNEDLLDKAVWRRFTLKLEFHNPEEKERENLFKLYLKDFPNKIDYKLFAKLTEGFSGSLIYDTTILMKKQTILSGEKTINNIEAIKNLLSTISFINTEVKIPKKQLYSLCQILKDNSFSYKDLEAITGIPYTTLKDNVK